MFFAAFVDDNNNLNMCSATQPSCCQASLHCQVQGAACAMVAAPCLGCHPWWCSGLAARGGTVSAAIGRPPVIFNVSNAEVVRGTTPQRGRSRQREESTKMPQSPPHNNKQASSQLEFATLRQLAVPEAQAVQRSSGRRRRRQNKRVVSLGQEARDKRQTTAASDTRAQRACALQNNGAPSMPMVHASQAKPRY